MEEPVSSNKLPKSAASPAAAPPLAGCTAACCLALWAAFLALLWDASATGGTGTAYFSRHSLKERNSVGGKEEGETEGEGGEGAMLDDGVSSDGGVELGGTATEERKASISSDIGRVSAEAD